MPRMRIFTAGLASLALVLTGGGLAAAAVAQSTYPAATHTTADATATLASPGDPARVDPHNPTLQPIARAADPVPAIPPLTDPAELAAQVDPGEATRIVATVGQADGRRDVQTWDVVGPQQTRDTAARVAAEPGVLTLDLDAPTRQTATPPVPNDPRRSTQYALDMLCADQYAKENVVGSTCPGWAGQKATGAGQVVAILDGGVDTAHPDLAGNLLPGATCMADPCTTRTTTPSNQVSWHGSMVAGIVNAVTNNAVGVSGFATGAALLPVQIFDPSGSGTVDGLVRGIYWAADNGATVINISGTTDADLDALKVATAYAIAKGVPVVASAGNLGITSPTQYPAAYPDVVGVGAIDSAKSIWEVNPGLGSSSGFWVDVVAPGVTIQSTCVAGAGDYCYATGTSMSAPMVAAAAAELRQRHPTWTPTQVGDRLQTTATDLGGTGRDDLYGYGLINPYLALSDAPAAPTGLAATPQPGGASVAFTAPPDGGAPLTNYEYSTDDGGTWTARSPAATTSPLTISGLTNGTTYLVRLRAVNLNGPGSPSAAVAVTPAAPPGAPTDVTATADYYQRAEVAFTPPTSDGGAAITNYEYSVDGTSWTALSPASTTSPVQISGLPNGTPLTIRLRAVNSAGSGPGATAAAPVTLQGAVFVPQPGGPTRVYDSRAPGGGGVISTGQSRQVRIDPGGIIPDSAVAIAYNVTLDATQGSGYLSVAPGGTASPPLASTINWWGANQILANGYVGAVNPSAPDYFTVFAGGPAATQFVFDVVGYYVPQQAPEAATGSVFVPVAPVRAYDSRNPGEGGVIRTGEQRVIDLRTSPAGAAVPTDSTGIAYTITVAGTEGVGYLAVAPGDAASAPSVSSINWFQPGEIAANSTTVGVDDQGHIKVFAGGPAATQFIIDIVGYYTASDPAGTLFTSTSPVRAYDSRNPGAGGALASGGTRTTGVAAGVVPSNATAFAYNLTLAATVNSGYLTVTPGGTATPPVVSTINWFQSEQIMANGTVVKLGTPAPTPDIPQVTTFAGGGGSSQYLIDVGGYFN